MSRNIALRPFCLSMAVLLLFTLPVGLAGAAEGLAEAYQKEFAFLETQKRELQRRLSESRDRAAADEAALRTAIDASEQRLLSLEAGNDRLNELLLESQRAIELNQDRSDTLAATLDQGAQSLADYGFPVADASTFDEGDDARRLALLFARATEATRILSGIHREEGRFFLADGRQVSGEIVHLGNIASFGLNPNAAGPLAPAGEGAMKLREEMAPGTVQDIARGEFPSPLRLFLYESADKAVGDSHAKDLLQTIDSGGVIGWVIVALGAIAVFFIVLRALFLRAAGLSTERLIGRVSALVAEGRVDDALAQCKQAKGATSRVLAATLRNLDRERDHLEDIISESILHESGSLNRFGSFIMVIAAVSPLLGLLGTVTGMIATFDVITEFGTGDPKLLSGGISTALVTTELGLVVAIPTLIFGNLLSGWSNRIKDGMEKAALHVTNVALNVRPQITLAAA